MTNPNHIVLIGFSGAGKSTVAAKLAQRLDWRCLDLDDLLVAHFGMTIPEVFDRRGEPAFRAAERAQLHAALQQDNVVLATGGGAVVADDVWTGDLLRSPGTLVVALDATPESILARLRAQQAREGAAVERPMIAGADPLTRIAALKEARQTAYDRADITLIVDAVDPDTVIAEILSLIDGTPESTAPIELTAGSGHSRIHLGPGETQRPQNLAKERWPRARTLWIITDEHVGALHGATVRHAFTSSGWTVNLHAVPAGEGSKSLATASTLYDWLLHGGIERGDLIVALGGGVIGDLAGFVAATVLRGVGLLQMPTSLLAMVDSSVGGKTGINHRAGKNLIGVITQPHLVTIDSAFLQTLPHRKLVEGWAEVIKHAVIQPSTPGGDRADLLRLLERNAANLRSLNEPATTYLIRRNVALKAAVVQADERETGIRAYLNFGHTLGHAIEAADYRYLHGEAIAAGMRAAMRIGEAIGISSAAQTARLDALLAAYDLPMSVNVDPESVFARLVSDKKRIAGRQRWVLPLVDGGVSLRDDIDDHTIRAALDAVRDRSP